VPWGISESAYAFTDRDGTYQYRAFGVPGSASGGARRRPRGRAVRTALASQVSPAEAVENLDGWPTAWRALRVLRVGRLHPADRGDDCSPKPRRAAVVRAYFSHHQGMSLVRLANVCARTSS
jgi:cyclic beta-1,2-glucan synthetase